MEKWPTLKPQWYDGIHRLLLSMLNGNIILVSSTISRYVLVSVDCNAYESSVSMGSTPHKKKQQKINKKSESRAQLHLNPLQSSQNSHRHQVS